MLTSGSGLDPAQQADQSPLCPSAQGGWIRQACRIFTVRCGLFGGIAGRDPLAGLLSAAQGVVPERHQPIRQDREGLLARTTDSTSCPEAFAPVIVARMESLSVADDGVLTADWTPPRQEVQRDHPGAMLFSGSGSAIKRITTGVKARR